MVKGNQYFSDEVEIKNCLLILDKYKFFILFFVLISFFCGLFLYKKQPVSYKSTLTFFILKDPGQGPSFGGFLGSFGSSLFSSGDPQDIIFGAVKSRTFSTLLKNDLNLKEAPLPKKMTVEHYLSKISVTKGENGIISFTSEWMNPQTAVKIANYFPTAIEKFNEEVHMIPIKSFIQVIDRAIISDVPFKYPFHLFLGIGVFIGLVVSVFLSFTFEFLLFLKIEYTQAKQQKLLNG